MGHFDDCTPDQRFTKTGHDSLYNGVGTKETIIDWDQRRLIAVATAWKEDDEEFFLDTLAEHIDNIPSDVMQIEIGEEVAFKYYINEGNMGVIWDETNCLLRISKHPNIIPFDSLVIDQVEGQDKVVGFTTPFVASGTIEDNVSRPFKLLATGEVVERVAVTCGCHGASCT
ncbi:hypothetical protein SLS64_009341 [Diaporthe eres]